jgi:PAS domain S-box-containing protein
MMMKLALGELHAGLQSVLDTALDAVVVMNLEGHVLGWNRHAAECFGWSPDEAVGRRLSELIIPPEHRAAHEEGLRRYLETGIGPVLNRHIEISGLHRDGREIPVELSITEADQFGGRLFIGFIRDISERQMAAERQQRLLSELNHRVKNMLSVVLAIAHQTARNAPDLETFQKAFTGRLHTLAQGHDLLVASEWKDVDVVALARQLLGAEAAAGRASISGEPVLLSANRVIGLVLILHELYTNAAKYGALAVPTGRIDLDWRIENGDAIVCWRESGLDGATPPSSHGFGHQMIAMTARADLQGSVEFEWRKEGLLAAIRFPVVP